MDFTLLTAILAELKTMNGYLKSIETMLADLSIHPEAEEDEES